MFSRGRHALMVSDGWVEFAHWWSFSGGGSAINGATPSSFINIIIITLNKFVSISAITDKPVIMNILELDKSPLLSKSFFMNS